VELAAAFGEENEKAGNTGEDAGDNEQKDTDAHVHALCHVRIGLAEASCTSMGSGTIRQQDEGGESGPKKESRAVHR
jgi:hypothetical protein